MSQNGKQGKDRQREKGKHSGRSIAEWATLGISVAILLIVIGLVSYQHLLGGSQSAAIEVNPQLQQVRQEGDAYYLPVEVINKGDKTAEDVRVEVSLLSEGSREMSAQLRITFLAGHETSRGTAVFGKDPREGALTTEVMSYLQP